MSNEHACQAGQAEATKHLSLTLILIGALPAPPSEMDEAENSAAPLQVERSTLDISLDDEETFGLCTR